MLSFKAVVHVLALTNVGLANVCSDVNGQVWQGTYSSSCTSTLESSGWSSYTTNTDGPYCTLSAKIKSNGHDVSVEVDGVSPTTCSSVHQHTTGSERPPQGPSDRSFSTPPNWVCANYKLYPEACLADQISVSLSTNNGTAPFGSSDCSTGFLQFNLSHSSPSAIAQLHFWHTNYTARLDGRVLTINRVFSQDNPGMLQKSVGSPETVSTSRTCQDTWKFFSPAPSFQNAVSIQSRETGMCLDLPGGNATNGNQLMLWPCLGNANQQWQFQETPRPRLVYAPSLHLDVPKCVDLMGGDVTNGKPLQIWDCADWSASPGPWGEGWDSSQQMWAFDAKSNMIYLMATQYTVDMQEANHTAGKCFDLRDGSSKNASAVQVWNCAAAIEGGFAVGWNQQWLLSALSTETVAPVVV